MFRLPATAAHHRCHIVFCFLGGSLLLLGNLVVAGKQERLQGINRHQQLLRQYAVQQEDAPTTATANFIRQLQGPLVGLNLTASKLQCGEIIAQLNVSELQSVTDSFSQTFFPNTTVGSDWNETLKYSVQVQFICSSCEAIQGLYEGESFLSNTSAYGFGKYCAADRYGYNITTSGLLLLPVDPSTGKVFTETLRSAVFTHGTTQGSQQSPSGLFPSYSTASWGDFLEVLPALIGTSAGAVSIVPDYIGYGHSYDYPKSYLVYSLYQQTSVTLWLAARHMLLSITSPNSGCTELESVVSVFGYSEGGYSAFSTCLALNQLAVGQSNLRIMRCQCGGAPFDLDYMVSYTLEQIQNKSAHESSPEVSVFLGNAYSSNNPDLANSNKGQDILTATYKALVPVWLDSPSFDSVPNFTELVSSFSILNSGFVDVYLGNRTNFTPTRSCSGPGLQNNETNLLCQAIVDNVLVNPLLSADFPTIICHARDDRLVPFGNVPNFSSNPNVQYYVPFDPRLEPKGDHEGGFIMCAVGTITAFASPSNRSDSPQAMSNLTNTSVCILQEPTTNSTQAPTAGSGATTPTSTIPTSPSTIPTSPSTIPTSPSKVPTTTKSSGSKATFAFSAVLAAAVAVATLFY